MLRENPFYFSAHWKICCFSCLFADGESSLNSLHTPPWLHLYCKKETPLYSALVFYSCNEFNIQICLFFYVYLFSFVAKKNDVWWTCSDVALFSSLVFGVLVFWSFLGKDYELSVCYRTVTVSKGKPDKMSKYVWTYVLRSCGAG